MTAPGYGHDREDSALLDDIEALLADPSHAANPLRPVLAQLHALHHQQTERMERLVRISDGYHGLTRQHSNTLADKFEREMRRLQKLARISDLYQRNLRELTEALREASLKDALTGLGNRRYLKERMREECARAQRKDQPLCVAILDIDHFKLINDNHGHDCGDQALCSMAAVFQQSLRDYDSVGRWGGEEFLILLPDTTQEAGLEIVERLRTDIARLRIEDRQQPERGPIILTVSIGLSVLRANEDISATLTRADNALIAAKRAGRNRCQNA